MAGLGSTRFLVFRVGELTCAAAAGDVREILPMSEPTRIPGAPPAVSGLINVRGTLVTLLDGRRALGLDASTGGESVILLHAGARMLGLAVDEVLDLVSVVEDALVDRRELAGVDSAYVKAVARHGEAAFAVLDTEAMLNSILPS